MPSNIIMADAKGGESLWEFLDEATLYLPKYTDTATLEETDTGIDVSNFDYAFLLAIITCDSPITQNGEWGQTVQCLGRYAGADKRVKTATYCAMQTKGIETVKRTELSSAVEMLSGQWGVQIENNKTKIIITRKAVGTFGLMRAGNYTVKIYGLKSLG